MNAFILSTLLLTQFVTLSETIPDVPFAYPGKLPREVITVDPENSPYLDQKYKQLTRRFYHTSSEDMLLASLARFVKEEVYCPAVCSLSHVNNWIRNHYPGESEPQIPLDAFAEARIGVCRHTALTTTYFLDRMIRDGYLTGSSYLIRADLPTGRHAWTLFISEKGAWHIDALWGFVDNAKTPSGFQRMCNRYGQDVMEIQKTRWTDET